MGIGVEFEEGEEDHGNWTLRLRLKEEGGKATAKE